MSRVSFLFLIEFCIHGKGCVSGSSRTTVRSCVQDLVVESATADTEDMEVNLDVDADEVLGNRGG
jgi:hypothetical protein